MHKPLLTQVLKVIIAMLDPNPLVNGKGVVILEYAGVEVKIGLLKMMH